MEKVENGEAGGAGKEEEVDCQERHECITELAAVHVLGCVGTRLIDCGFGSKM
jgi:hypothetical protein